MVKVSGITRTNHSLKIRKIQVEFDYLTAIWVFFVFFFSVLELVQEWTSVCQAVLVYQCFTCA